MASRLSQLPSLDTSGLLARIPGLTLLAPLLALSLCGCPKQELAPLGPCTVAAVSERVDQSGVADVDLLFVLDNSASMASEQAKLARELPNLVAVLTSGDRYKGRENQAPPEIADKDRYFPPVKTMHLGVVSTNLGGIDGEFLSTSRRNVRSCAGNGDDAVLLNSTAIAVNGQTAEAGEFRNVPAGGQLVAPVAGCDEVDSLAQYQAFEVGEEPSAEQVTQNFSCVSAVGVLGCPFEQQLEAMWKALAPRDGLEDPSLYEFLNGTKGQGERENAGFLRPDAVLAVLIVSDEEDCSITDDGKFLFPQTGRVNMLCGENAHDPTLVRPVERYITGLKSLKPDNPDRIIFGAIVGVPEEAIAQRQSIDEMLERDDMQFVEELDDTGKKTGLPVPSCLGFTPGAPEPDKAYPPRRMLQVAKAFEASDQAVIHSICADDYAEALETLIQKIASKLSGNCLPRKLNPGSDGKVNCEVFELLPDGEDDCSSDFGLTGKPIKRVLTENNKTKTYLSCKMEQVAVVVRDDGTRGPEPGKVGWFYDDFDPSLVDDCQEDAQQRISFTFDTLPKGAGATFECFQTVARIDAYAVGAEAVNVNCGPDGVPDNSICEKRSTKQSTLFCLEALHTCQIACDVNPDCPPGWVCDTGQGGTAGPPKYCQLPTCPQDSSATN